MRGFVGMAFMRAFAELERREARKRKKNAQGTRKDIACSVCRTYGGETCGRRDCRKCEKERERERER